MKIVQKLAPLAVCALALVSAACSKKSSECDALNAVYAKTTRAEARSRLATQEDAEKAAKIVEAEFADVGKITVTDEKLKSMVSGSNALDGKWIAEYRAYGAALAAKDDEALKTSGAKLTELEAEEKKFDKDFDAYCK